MDKVIINRCALCEKKKAELIQHRGLDLCQACYDKVYHIQPQKKQKPVKRQINDILGIKQWKTPKERLLYHTKAFLKQYPEKKAAWAATSHLPKIPGYHLHHWSYNELHYTDIIRLKIEDHYKIHQYIVYDPETKMYRDKRSGYLFDTKKEHRIFIDLVLQYY